MGKVEGYWASPLSFHPNQKFFSLSYQRFPRFRLFHFAINYKPVRDVELVMMMCTLFSVLDLQEQQYKDQILGWQEVSTQYLLSVIFCISNTEQSMEN